MWAFLQHSIFCFYNITMHWSHVKVHRKIFCMRFIKLCGGWKDIHEGCLLKEIKIMFSLKIYLHVHLKKALNDWVLLLYWQLRVRAQDQGFPQLFATATVEISISRTTEFLSFILPSYTQTISENQAVASFVTQVTAQPGVRLICLFTNVNLLYCKRGYCGWLNFRGVPIFVVFVEGAIHEFQYQRISDFLYEKRRKILWSRILNPRNVSFLFNPRKLVPTKIKPSTVFSLGENFTKMFRRYFMWG